MVPFAVLILVELVPYPAHVISDRSDAIGQGTRASILPAAFSEHATINFLRVFVGNEQMSRTTQKIQQLRYACVGTEVRQRYAGSKAESQAGLKWQYRKNPVVH